MRKILNDIILTVFYCGKSPKAPGTVASFFSVLLWIAVTKLFFSIGIRPCLQTLIWFAIILGATYYGFTNIPQYLKDIASENVDHSSITIDEFIGQTIALQISFMSLSHHYVNGYNSAIIFHVIFCFITFRIFDIRKPSVIGAADKQIKSPIGVIFDDILSGIVAGVSSSILMIIF